MPENCARSSLSQDEAVREEEEEEEEEEEDKRQTFRHLAFGL
jgi:hypothetical protein